MTAELAIEPGIYQISNEEHHALKALSNSGMKDLAVSPLRYWYRHINPAPQEEKEETISQRMGSALHCAVLESPEAFDSRYTRALDPSDWPVCLDKMDEIRTWIKDHGEAPKGTRKDEVVAQAKVLMGKLGVEVPILQEEERRFFAQHGHKTILHPDEWERLAGMARALAEEPALRPILTHGKAEQTLIARDPETGVLLKARLDWMAPRITLDLKTFTQKRGASIDRSVADAIYYERYWVQGYFYDLVRRLATGEGHERCDFVMAFVESDQPHEVRLKRLLPKTGGEVNLYWESARIEVRQRIREYANCLAKYGDDPWRSPREIDVLSDDEVKQFAFRSE